MKRVVLDANILIRAVLGARVMNVFSAQENDVSFLVPETCLDEAERHLPVIAAKRSLPAQPLLQALEQLQTLLEVVDAETFTPYRDAALARVGKRDPMDWPIVATALACSCPIWTEDRDFFGVGIPTWTTSTIEIYLNEN